MKKAKGAAIIVYKIKNNLIEILLGKRKYFPNIGYWTIPGGKMEEIDNNNFENTAKRECEEETGIKINSKLILLDEIRENQFIWNTYIGEVDSTTNNIFIDEVSESGWFNTSNLPSPLVDLLENQIKRTIEKIL